MKTILVVCVYVRACKRQTFVHHKQEDVYSCRDRHGHIFTYCIIIDYVKTSFHLKHE